MDEDSASPPPSSSEHAFTTVPADDGERIDRVVAAHVDRTSRRVARSLCQAGAVRVDGKRAPPSERVHVGQRVVVHLPLRAAEPGPPLSILETSDDFVFANKPPAIHTVRLRPGDATTLADQIGFRYPECVHASGDPNEAGALHRLDFGTSGVVAFARSQRAHTEGRDALRHGLKLYLAICRVVPPPAGPDFCGPLETPPPAAPLGVDPIAVQPGTRIEAPLAGRGARSSQVFVDPDGQPSTTLAWDLGPAPTCDTESRWMLVQLLTGRRHQARVHLAHIGRPIVSDAAYAPQFPAPHRPLLHAWALQLGSRPRQDGDASGVLIRAPLPADFPPWPARSLT